MEYLKCYYDQNFMSRFTLWWVPNGLSYLVSPVYVPETNLRPRKVKISGLKKYYYRVRHYGFAFRWARGLKAFRMHCFVLWRHFLKSQRSLQQHKPRLLQVQHKNASFPRPAQWPIRFPATNSRASVKTVIRKAHLDRMPTKKSWTTTIQ